MIAFIAMYYKNFLRVHWKQEEIDQFAKEMKHASVNFVTFKICMKLKNQFFSEVRPKLSSSP